MVESSLALWPGCLELPPQEYGPSGVDFPPLSAFMAAAALSPCFSLTQPQRKPINTQTTCLLLQGGFLLWINNIKLC